MTTLLLTLIYPLLVAARVMNALSGRDPLRRRPPAGSLWIERDQATHDAGYFSEASPNEGRGNGGSGRLAAAVLSLVARWHAPPRSQPREKFSAVADREPGIPDEMYTLW